VRVLSWLAYPGVISALSWPTVRLVRVVLDYRLRCKEIELRRQQLRLDPGSQPAQAACARHAVRRCKRR
jgi:hypothetical protein